MSRLPGQQPRRSAGRLVVPLPVPLAAERAGAGGVAGGRLALRAHQPRDLGDDAGLPRQRLRQLLRHRPCGGGFGPFQVQRGQMSNGGRDNA